MAPTLKSTALHDLQVLLYLFPIKPLKLTLQAADLISDEKNLYWRISKRGKDCRAGRGYGLTLLTRVDLQVLFTNEARRVATATLHSAALIATVARRGRHWLITVRQTNKPILLYLSSHVPLIRLSIPHPYFSWQVHLSMENEASF